MARWHIGLQLPTRPLRKHRSRGLRSLRAPLAAIGLHLPPSRFNPPMRNLTRAAMGWQLLWVEATSLSLDLRRQLRS